MLWCTVQVLEILKDWFLAIKGLKFKNSPTRQGASDQNSFECIWAPSRGLPLCKILGPSDE